MDPIKEAMKEVYKGHGMSKAKKIETRQNVRKPKKMILPVAISAVLTAAMLFFIFSMIEQQDSEVDRAFSVSSREGAEDEVIAMMERKRQFQSIIEDGIITEQERMDYLRTSDWHLQLAFEHIANTVYPNPAVTQEQGLGYATLLFYMREYILSPQNTSEVAAAFAEVRGFKQLLDLLPVMDNYILAEYLPSKDEELPVNRVFFNLAQGLQVVIVIMYAISLFFIMKNLIARQRIWLTMANILVVMLTAIFFFKPMDTYYANDETTLFTSSLKAMDSIGLTSEDVKLVSSATFDNSRFALLQEQNRHTLVRFQKRDNSYQFTEINSWPPTQIMSAKYHVRNDGQAIYVFALTEGHSITKGILTIHDKEKRTVEFSIEKGNAAIEALYLPQKDISFELKFYDEFGEVVK